VEWLWKQYAEHRVPLAKLIWLGLLELTDYDFRLGNFLCVWAMGILALAMIQTVKALRGYSSVFDAFFPLAILNLGQSLNFVWWWVVNHLLAPLVANALLLIVVLYGSRMTPRHRILVGIGAVLLTLCGPGGLLYALALALWLCLWPILHQSPTDYAGKVCNSVTSGLAWASVLLVGLYFVGYDTDNRVWMTNPNAGWADVARAAMQALGISF